MIRPYQPEDQPELLALLQRNIPTYFAASEANDFVTYLAQEAEDYFVVEEQGQLVGAGGLNYFDEESLARLSWDIVHPDFHGKGIGSRLTRHRLELLKRKASVKRVVVRTSQLVYPFYAKMGFALEKTEKDYWAPGFDLYQMSMTLL